MELKKRPNHEVLSHKVATVSVPRSLPKCLTSVPTTWAEKKQREEKKEHIVEAPVEAFASLTRQISARFLRDGARLG